MDIDEPNVEISPPTPPPPPLDGVAVSKNRIPIYSKVSDLTAPNSNDLVLRTVGSMSRAWTNEKHSLYLNSMEASFVRRLYNHEHHSVNRLGQHSRRENRQDLHMSLNPNAHDHKSSNQFKVLQSGCWKTINFESAQPKMNAAHNSHIHMENQQKNSLESAQPKMNTADDSQIIMKNQWIQHFRCTGKHQEFALPSLQENSAESSKHQELSSFNMQENGARSCEYQELPNLQENGAQSSKSIYIERQDSEHCEAVDQQNTASYEETTSKKLQPGYSHKRDQDYTSSNTVPSFWLVGPIYPHFGESSETNHTEVSDQNFVDDDSGENSIKNHHLGVKKMKMTTTDGFSRDQVC